MKIAIVTDIHLGTDLQLAPAEGPLRASSSLVESRLPHLLRSIKKLHAPDYWFNLGDVFRSESVEKDITHYRRGLQILHQECQPLIHLIGNHEIRALSHAQVKELWNEVDYHREEYGAEIIGGVKFIWLGIENRQVEGETLAHLSKEQLQWLESELQQGDEPVVILSHYAYNQQDLSGNFYFEHLHKTFSCYANQSTVRDLIYRYAHRVKMTLNGHVHWLHTQFSTPVPHLTLPSMIENIAAPGGRVFPGVYTILTFDNDVTTAKSYAQDYCFFSVELPPLTYVSI